MNIIKEELRMNFIDFKNILKDYSHQIDLFNTLNGGVSMATVNISETEHNIIFDVAAPTVDPDAVNIYVSNNKLVVFIELRQPDAAESSATGGFKVPLFTRTYDIPFYVDHEKIEAAYDEGKIRVFLPIRKSGKNYNKKIEVKNW
jgi:HSP20 family protein